MLAATLPKGPAQGSSKALISRCGPIIGVAQKGQAPRLAAAFSTTIVRALDLGARSRQLPALWAAYGSRDFGGKSEGSSPAETSQQSGSSSSSTAAPSSSSSSSSAPAEKPVDVKEAKTGEAAEAEAVAEGKKSAEKAPGEKSKAESEGKEKSDSKAEGEGSKKEGKEGEKKEGDKSKKEGEEKGPTPEQQRNLVMGSAFVSGVAAYTYATYEAPEEITTQELLRDFVVKGEVSKLQIVNRSRCRVYLKDGSSLSKGPNDHLTINLGSLDSFESKVEQVQDALGVDSADRIPIQYVQEINWTGLLSAYGPTILITLSILLGIRGMMNGNPMGGFPGRGGMGGGLGGGGQGGGRNMFNMGKAFAEGKGAVKSDVRFKDVAGQEQAKREVVEFVDFLRNPEKYNRLGARIPKGGLLVGPPGTGKTLLAKAVAGEAECPFYAMSGSDFVEMYGGVGAARVRDLFKTARENSPSIVFIDEIDAIGRKRSSGKMGGNEEREGTLNQMLVEMDGFNPSTGVVVLAGTNRSDILDQALLRPGRFDRQIQVDKPDLGEREAIFMVHLKPVKLDPKLSPEAVAKRMATLTPGFAGADIGNICNEAAIHAARRGGTMVELVDFERATERVMAGLPKETNLMSLEQRKTVALHESGHAVAGWFLEHADPLLKVSIVPRSNGAGGFAQYLPKEMALHSREAILDRMAMTLGGRAAEELFVGKISTGASDDLDKVTQMAYAMVSVYGMNKKIGLLSWNNQGGDSQFYKPYSEATNKLMDREARRLVDKEYTRVKELLTEKQEVVRAMSETLLKKETLVYSDLLSVLGDRPHEVEAEYQKYLTKSGNPFTTPVESDSPETEAGAVAAAASTAAAVRVKAVET